MANKLANTVCTHRNLWWNDNIVVFGLFTGGQIVQLIMEYLPLGSLKDYLLRDRPGMAKCLLFAQQICEVSERVSSDVLFPFFTLSHFFDEGSGNF